MIGDSVIRHEVLGWLAIWFGWPRLVFVPMGLPVIVVATLTLGLLAELLLALGRHCSREQVAARRAWRSAFDSHLSQRGNYASYRPALGRSVAPVMPEQWVRIEDARSGSGYVYVIQMSNGMTKVGKTIEPRRRVSSHHRLAAAHKVRLVKVWVSRPHADYGQTELRLIKFCAARSSQVRREYFDGMDFYGAVNYAKKFDGTEHGPWGSPMPLEAEEATAMIDAAIAAHEVLRS